MGAIIGSYPAQQRLRQSLPHRLTTGMAGAPCPAGNLGTTMTTSPTARPSIRRASARIGLTIAATMLTSSMVLAQTVSDNADIPSNVQLFGEQNSNVFRPTARVNDEIITATDVEQRVALVRLANR